MSAAAPADLVIQVGAQPPPVHGLSLVNDAMRQLLERRLGALPVLNVSGGPVGRLRALAAVARAAPGSALYMSVSGGLGQYYEIAALAAARARGLRIFLHHHSFAYLDTRRRATAALVAAAGPRAVHVCLSPRMGEKLREAYGAVRVRSLSNAAFVAFAPEAPAVRRRLACIGLLGNLCAAKGVFDFLDTVEQLVVRGVPLRARLAGPFDSDATRAQVLGRAARLPVEYVGPRYGEDKARFYAGIDTLLFPTRYVNEAEPLTILEALMHGVPVIAFARGCIPELLQGGAGRRVAPEEDFAQVAAARLERWHRRPETLASASSAAARRFAELRTAALEARAGLLQEICGSR